MISDLGLIRPCLVAGLIGLATAVVCPDSSQWSLRTRAYCNSTHSSYYCLYDESSSTFVDFCTRRPDFQRPGYKFIIRGNIDGIECGKNRFQPIKFWTNGSNDCILEKTGCNEPGQVIHNEGSSTSDRTCRCDYTRGFDFVTRPKQDCFCNPSLEDCSCFMKPCSKFQVMTPDYNCIKASDWTGIFRCPVITTTMSTSATLQKTTRCPTQQTDLHEFSKRHTAITVSVFLVVIITIVIFILMCGKQTIGCCRNAYMMDAKIKEWNKIQGLHESQMNNMILNHEIVDETKAAIDLIKRLKEHIQQEKEDMENIPRNILGLHEDQMNNRILNQEIIDETKASINLIRRLQEQIQQEKEEMEKIPRNIREKYDQHIEGWEKDNQTFIVTEATKYIYEKLMTDNCVLVVGGKGSGKSSIIRHIGLQLFREDNYELIPIVLCPSNILSYQRKNRKQVFVIDDFCGKFLINAQNVDVWSTHMEALLKLIKTDLNHHNTRPGYLKVLFASNEDIFNEKIFGNRLEPLIEFCCKLSDNPLTNEEKVKMIKKYIPTKEKTKLKTKLISDEVHFPLLYKLSKGKTADQIVKLFANLDDFIKQDLLTLKENNDMKFCIISFCALFENHFNENMLNDNFKFATQKEENAFNEMCTEFSFDLHKDSSRMRLKEQLQSSEDTYLSKTEDYYSLTESIVYQVAEIVCAQTFINCFIKFAPSSFIAARYRFKSTTEEKNDDVVWINEIYHEKEYFNRLILDLEEGITYSTFHNAQLCNILYRNKFLSYCMNRKEKINEILRQIKESKKSLSKSEQCPVDEKSDYEDYLDFKKPYHFISHKMRMPLIESAWEGYSDIVKMLLEMGCDIDETDKFKRTALIVGSYLNKTEVVTELLDSGASHSLCDEKGQSALLIASREGYYDIVKALLKQKASTELCDFKGQSSLMVASICGHKDIVEVLLTSWADISKCDNAGRSSLFLACLNGRKDVVSVLIRNKANVNQCDVKGLSPLLVACKTENENVIRAVIKAGADISNVDSEGRFPLFIACEGGFDNVVKILISKGANETQCDWENRSPLFIACEKGHLEIVTSLIKSNHGLINICDEDGRSSLFVACEKGRLKIAEILLDHGANINNLDKKRRSPFYAACRSGFPEIVKLLHSKGATVDDCSIWGCSPLFEASREGHFDVVELLINLKCKVSEANSNGKTPLIVACEEGNVKIAELLIKSDADVNVRDNEKRTSLHVACFVGYSEIVQLLIINGANENLRDIDENTPLEIARKKEYNDIVELLTSKVKELKLNNS